MRLGDLLINKYHIPPAYIDLALKEQAVTKEKLGEILTRMDLVPVEIVARALGELHGLKYFNIFTSTIEDVECDRDTIEEFKLVPIKGDEEDTIIAGLINPFDLEIRDGVERYFHKQGKKVVFAIISNDTFKEYLERKTKISTDEIKSYLSREIKSQDTKKQLHSAEHALRMILLKGIYEKASDIHIEPTYSGGRIRFRIHGTLKTIMAINDAEYLRLINTIKLASNMSVTERYVPQDKRIDSSFLKNSRYVGVDFRVSAIPNWTSSGVIESVVIRILDKRTSVLPLTDLGMDPQTLDFLLKSKDRPYGMLIFVGPTGSGKTTTIYSTMTTINAIEKAVITVEDPVEYRNFLWKQIQVNDRLSFATALRSILRHDPDILFCGEIRDEETAEIAFEMANTGHLVFTTLHANDSVKAITRLRELNVSRGLIESTILGIVSQRLIKVLCDKCKEIYEHKELGTIYKAKGCPYCNWSGYKGRVMVSEVFPFNDRTYEVLDLALKEQIITARQKLDEIYGNMYHNALNKVKQGITSLEEVQRCV